MGSADPLLQPYALGHLVLRNPLISTAHEPTYTEDDLPEDRCRLYHVEKAKGGIGMTMIGGSSVLALDRAEAVRNQAVIECGTLPLDARYFELKSASQNLGEVDYAALLATRPQAVAPGPGTARAPSRIDG